MQVEIDVSLMLPRKENCSPFRLDVADIAVLLQCRAVLSLEPHVLTLGQTSKSQAMSMWVPSGATWLA